MPLAPERRGASAMTKTDRQGAGPLSRVGEGWGEGRQPIASHAGAAALTQIPPDSARARPHPCPSPKRERGPAPHAGALAILAAFLAGPAWAASPVVVGDAIPASLTGRPGDLARGRAIVVDRTRGLCLLCHAGPFPEARFQGDLSPSLAGTGSRWSEGELRLRVVDARRINPDTIMPPYFSAEGLDRVGTAWRGRTLLDAAEVEDVVAFLVTLKE